MVRTALAAALCLVALALLCLPAGAQTLLFSDNLENGSTNWTTYPGSPTCTPLQNVTTSTDPNCNHTPGGSHGLKMTQASDRVYHDVNLGIYAGSIRFSMWFYDSRDYRPSSWSSFDVRSAGLTQVLGMSASYNDPSYRCRVMATADGRTAPGWVDSSIIRSVGWHHFEIYQLRGKKKGTVQFFVDGVLGYSYTNAYDDMLNRVVLGVGYPIEVYQSGYADDISVSAVPEPSCLFAVAMGLVGLAGIVRRRR